MHTLPPLSGRERMIRAYRGQWADARVVAPEFWYYVPARVLDLDMVAFEREVPLWQALHQTIKHYGCEGWCITWPDRPLPNVEQTTQFRQVAEGRYQEEITLKTPAGTLMSAKQFDLREPSWVIERPVKNLARDFEVWLETAFPPIDLYDYTQANAALKTVGNDYLLEIMVGGMFFDFVAEPMGLQEGIIALSDHPQRFVRLQLRYIDYMREATRSICEHTQAAPIFIYCAWSCASLIGPRMWRQWDKPVVEAIVAEAHQHGRLVHIHYHGKAMANLPDLIETNVDCICPFERPPGGDIVDLQHVRDLLGGRITMNGNVHTVETLIRGTPNDIVGEVMEIGRAFEGEPRLIIGTGDQVGFETPDENIWAMIAAARDLPNEG